MQQFHLLLPLLLIALVRVETIIIETGETGEDLTKYLCNTSRPLLPNTTILLAAGTHYVGAGDFCELRDLSDVAIRGSTEGESVIECTAEEGRGFIFSNITNLTLEGFTVRYCGQIVPNDLRGYFNVSTGYLGPGQKVVLLLDHCSNVDIRSVDVDRYYGMALFSVNSMGSCTVSRVAISNSRTAEHKICTPHVKDLRCSGAGMGFLYSDNFITKRQGGPVSLVISNSSTTNNSFFLPFDISLQIYVIIRSAAVTQPVLMTCTAMSFYMSQTKYNVNITVDGSKIDKNTGDVPAVAAIFYNTIRNTHLQIKNTVFTNNTGNLASGGSLILAFTINVDALSSFPEYPSDIFDAVKLAGCVFSENTAGRGGAIFLHTPPQNISDFSILIENTTMANNAATYGSAIFISSTKSSYTPKDPHITLKDVDVYGNRLGLISDQEQTIQEESAVISIVGVYNIEIIGSENTQGSTFHDNSVPVLLTSNVNIVLRGKITFENNHGFNGGAISMYDNSIIFFQEGSDILFKDNTALQSGGAIYANSLGSAISQTCVMQVLGPSRVIGSKANLLNLSITFENNSAQEAGNSIFGDPLFQCFYLPEASIIHTNFYDSNSEVYSLIFNFTSKVKNQISEISSNSERVCICRNSSFNALDCNSISAMSVFPGQTFTVYLVPVDIEKVPVASILSSELQVVSSESSSSYQLGPGQSTKRLPGTTACTKTKFNIYGPEKGEVQLFFSTSTSDSKTFININVESCPPGFVPGTNECMCSKFVLDTIMTTCNMSTYVIIRPESGWIGLSQTSGNSSKVVFVSTCPIKYCDDEVTEVDLRIPNQLCMSGRIGILCGACKNGVSSIFGSADCKKCTNSWLAVILIFAVLGPLLVFLLFLLNLTVARGTINGLIFYANVVTVNANIFFRGSGQGFLFVFISLLNLELGFPLCFYDGMSEVAKVGLQYIFPLYLLFICAAIILLSRWFKIVQRQTAKSGIQVLATVFYLSYSKILRTIIDSLTYATLHSDNGDHQPIWLFDGNIYYCQGIHLFLFILAVLVTIGFIAPYSIYLSLLNVIQKFHTSQRLKPFIDAYTAPYEDKWRFWFGLRLHILIVVCTLFATQGTDNPGLSLLIQNLFILAFMTAQAYIQPFKNVFVSLLDLFFLFNLTVLILSTTHIVDTENYKYKQVAVSSILVGLVFCVFVGIITYHVIIALFRINAVKDTYTQFLKNAKAWYFKKRNIVKLTPPSAEIAAAAMSSVVMTNLNEPSSSQKTMVTFTEVGVDDEVGLRTSKAQTFSKLREQVLDYTTY